MEKTSLDRFEGLAWAIMTAIVVVTIVLVFVDAIMSTL